LPIDFKPFCEVALLLYDGPWLAERYVSIEGFLKEHANEVHPITRAVIEGGTRYSAAELFKAQHRLRTLRELCMKVFEQAEVLVVPTVPTIPTLADVKADSITWSRRLGYYTNFANLLQLAALAVPSGFTPTGLPGGITLLAPAGSERRLCELGVAWQRRCKLPTGVAGQGFVAQDRDTKRSVRVAVAGAHLRGQPLHDQLLRTGAKFVKACHTASRYRFLALMHLDPPRPGLLRDDKRAGAVDVEIYELSMEGFGQLVASVAPPLAIGTIELADGEAVKGFLCESFAAVRARDITEFGGWKAFRDHLAQGKA
jgi:allophanate hydrolase